MKETISFGPFTLVASERRLTKAGVPVDLSARAFDLLAILLSRPGDVVSKGELLAQAWPGISVEEGSLRFHIANLRKALGDGVDGARYILTLPGRGYCFAAQASRSGIPEQGAAKTGPDFHQANLPGRPSAMIGREEDLEKLSSRLKSDRFVTIVGSGGVGKTTVAVAVAHQLSAAFGNAVLFVDLGTLSDPTLVGTTVASFLGLSVQSSDATASLIAYLKDKRLLLILDTCEHLIEAVAKLASTIFAAAPDIHILATSRESLQVDGEYVYRLAPLAYPPEDHEPAADVMRTFPAIRLFVERAIASGARLDLNDDEAAIVASICRKLDGVALAIELAARHVETYGLDQTAALLNRRLAYLWEGPRTAPARQKTLQATLDWSYGLLSETERIVLRRLTVFVGLFTLDAALVVASGEEIDQATVFAAIDNLVGKSMVATRPQGAMVRYRLLDTTRAYALDTKDDDNERTDVAVRHATYYRQWLEQAATEWSSTMSGTERVPYLSGISNVRVALEWCFGTNGDLRTGVALAAAAAPVFLAMSLLPECHQWSERALRALAGATHGNSEEVKALAQIDDATARHYEMVLQCSLGLALIYAQGNIAPARTALTRALALAQELGDLDYEQRATYDLWLFLARSATSNEALVFARRYEEIVRARDPQSQPVADWIVGIPLTYMGAHGEAAERLHRAIEHYPSDRRRRDLVRFGGDLRASASAHLTVNLLSLGRLDAASRTALFSIEEARGTGHPSVLCISLAWAAGFVFLSLDEQDRAELFGDELIDCAYKHSLRPFHAAGLCVRGTLAARRGDPAAGIDLLRSGLAEMKQASYLLFYPFYVLELATALGAIGHVDDGLSKLDAALHLAAEIDYRWFVPELLRAKGELLALRGLNNAATAEDLFRRSMSQAREQRAPYWELCTAASLADLMRRQRNCAEARSILAPAYDQLTEGHSALRVRQARMLLDQLV
jgi:predicted ATPase/DNA-binding winged helix-turn-helix (wHTH) protein